MGRNVVTLVRHRVTASLRHCVPAAVLLTLACGLLPAAGVEICVGLVAFQDFADDWDRYRELFTDLSQASGGALRFRLTAGTYGDTLYWLRRDLIDIAILSPGVAAESLREDPASGKEPLCRYLATKGMRPARSALALPGERTPGYRDGYRAACIVPQSSPIRDLADLRLAVTQGRVQLLFVHPLSVSGHLAPLAALRQALSPEVFRMALGQSVFTSSHSNSLRLLGERLPGKERIAFLYDDALADDPDAEAGLRRVDFPELDGLRIPADAVVARREYAEADPVAELLLQHVDEAGVKDFLRLPAGAGAYAGVQTWTDAAEGAGGLDEAQLVSLDEIGWLLLHEARSQGRPPRLALVLSGGGAKCAYQLGVVRALEEKLAELRRLAPGLSLDIALVVGTSGGAVNALPVALGVTSTPEGQESFRALWSEMDQRELIRVPWLVRANLGLWFACIQLALVGWGVRRWVSDRGRRYRLGALVLLGLSLVAVALQLLPVSPWALLGRNHVLHHLWLWGSLGALFAAQCLLVLAVGGLLFEAWCRRRGRALRPVPVWLLRLPLLGILLLPLAQGLTMFLAEESLSGGAGIERALSRKLTALVDGHLQRQGLAPLDLHAAGSDAQRLRSVSRQIIERGLLRRDLVLTASCLSRTITVLPSDLYFYAPAAADSPAPGYGPRGVSLTGRPELLLDVMMGSGTIFPLFPARTLNGFPAAGERVELIDGGFAHNSPVEAAVLWGATHIILVNPTPERPLERGSLAGNLAAAFRHLYQQAQLIDARNQGKVAVFSLRPDPNAMCVLDFADNLIAGAVARGYEDARGVVRVGETERLGRPRFRKEAGEPTHWLTVPAEP